MSWLNIVKPSNQGKYQFNLSIGARSVSQSNVIAQTNPTEPVKLVRFDKNRIVEDGALNIFAALHWRYEFALRFSRGIPRNAELSIGLRRLMNAH